MVVIQAHNANPIQYVEKNTDPVVVEQLARLDTEFGVGAFGLCAVSGFSYYFEKEISFFSCVGVLGPSHIGLAGGPPLDINGNTLHVLSQLL